MAEGWRMGRRRAGVTNCGYDARDVAGRVDCYGLVFRGGVEFADDARAGRV